MENEFMTRRAWKMRRSGWKDGRNRMSWPGTCIVEMKLEVQMSPYRILSIDGGGMRGLITAILLQRLEAAHPGVIDQFDLFAGTSTGGLLALGLASGKSPAEARCLYEQKGARVFADTLLDNLRDLGSLIGANYDLEPLQAALTEEFGDLILGDLTKKVLISAFDLDNRAPDRGGCRAWKAKFFHNFPGPGSDAGERVVDVGVYTSAAPTYFPVHHGYIDGGVVAGNPSVCALAQALHPDTGGRKLEDVVLLSMGTGQNPRYLQAEEADWGLAQWAPYLVNLMLEGSSGLADYQCRQFLGRRYLRVNPRLPEPIGMDKVAKIPLMQQIAMQCNLDEAIRWVDTYFD
jgi:patatin-like phospholipase/acyl hydrolase